MSKRSYDVRPIDQSLDDYVSIAGEGLLSNDRSAWQLYVDRIGIENMRGVYDGSRLAGGMAFYRMGQWFGGKALPCAGISGVAVSPTDRGSGACATLMRTVLRELRDDGIPIASLYASTQYLYRTVGFEHAGSQTQYSLPISSIGCHDRRLDTHRFESPPADKLNRVADARAALTNGNLGRSDGLWQRLLNPYDGRGSITYLFGDLDNPEGYAILRPGIRDGGVPQPLVSTDVAANTIGATRRLLSLVRDHRSMCDAFEWFGPPNDSLHFLAEEQFITIKHFIRWMMRIVDLSAALAGRGYDDAVDGELHLSIRDDVLVENTGHWIVRVEGGAATVEPGGHGSLDMDIRFLAPLFSNFYSAAELVRLGAIKATDEQQVRLANRVFSGPAPWLPELF